MLLLRKQMLRQRLPMDMAGMDEECWWGITLVWSYICVFYVQSTECILLFNEANFDNTHLWMNPVRILNTLLVITVDKSPPILSLLFSFGHYGSSSSRTEDSNIPQIQNICSAFMSRLVSFVNILCGTR